MQLYEALEAVKFDKRLIEWNLTRGIISTNEVKKQTDGLPDLSSNCEKLDFEFEESGNGSAEFHS